MSNSLILLALLGGGFYYVSKKKKPVQSKSKENLNKSLEDSKDPENSEDKPSLDIEEELPKNKIPLPTEKGIIITNCNFASVSHPETYQKFKQNLLNALFNNSDYNVYDKTAPFEFAKQYLKNIDINCYNFLITNSPLTYQQFILMFVFLTEGFNGYLHKLFETINGNYDGDAWIKYFKTQEEYQAYKTEANIVFQTWYSPFVKYFNISNLDDKRSTASAHINIMNKYP